MTAYTITLDASGWKSAHDFRLAFKKAIGAPEWHGDIVAAFLDSIFGGGMNALKPPYVIRVVNTADLGTEMKEMLHAFSSALAETRARRLARTGEDVAVRLEIEDRFFPSSARGHDGAAPAPVWEARRARSAVPAVSLKIGGARATMVAINNPR